MLSKLYGKEYKSENPFFSDNLTYQQPLPFLYTGFLSNATPLMFLGRPGVLFRVALRFIPSGLSPCRSLTGAIALLKAVLRALTRCLWAYPSGAKRA